MDPGPSNQTGMLTCKVHYVDSRAPVQSHGGAGDDAADLTGLPGALVRKRTDVQ